MNQWDHKDEWRQRGKDFLVTVTRHSVTPIDDGRHRWAVYAYVYPEHPHFAKFDGTSSLYQDAARALPLHRGASLIRYHYDHGGNVTSVQVGADYHHLHDDHYTYIENAGDATSVFRDAGELHTLLSNTIQEASLRAPPKS